MRYVLIPCLLVLILPGCASLDAMTERFGMKREPAPVNAEPAVPLDPMIADETAEPATALAPQTAAPPPPPTAQTAEALDTTTPEQRAAAAAPAEAPVRALGSTIVTLGSPTEPGLWLKTPLVAAEAQGRVTNPANGKSSLVTLIPLEGPKTAGSRMSLAALRLIEASLTDLTEVQVALEG